MLLYKHTYLLKKLTLSPGSSKGPLASGRAHGLAHGPAQGPAQGPWAHACIAHGLMHAYACWTLSRHERASYVSYGQDNWCRFFPVNISRILDGQAFVLIEFS